MQGIDISIKKRKIGILRFIKLSIIENFYTLFYPRLTLEASGLKDKRKRFDPAFIYKGNFGVMNWKV
jgi:hypothetical protein